MGLKYQNGFIFEGHTFVVDKSDIRNAKDEQFVEGVALLPIEEAKPLTLDELREMDGKPVWIKEDEEVVCGIVSLASNCFCLEKEPVITLANGDFYLLREYNGKTWIAYRTKPERSGK